MAEASHITERRQRDKERLRLATLDKEARERGEGSCLLLNWTLKTYQEGDEMGRRPGVKNKATQAAALLDALKFVSVAASRDDLVSTGYHVRLAGNMAVAYDGQLAAGYPIAEELTLCPQITQLTKALSRSGKSLVISETPNGRLSIKGEKLQAYVQCLNAADMPPATPDPKCAVIDDRLKAAFKCCGTLASENGTRVTHASLLLRANECTGTNGAAILQFWHGINLPPDMVLPKVFCATVATVKAPLTEFGASWNAEGKVSSVTFYFEGGAWLKTETYADAWPASIDGLWWQANYSPVPDGLFDGIDAVADFNEDGFITFVDNAVQSHTNPNIGAQYQVKGLQAGKQFAGKLVGQISPWCEQIDLTTYPDRAFFIGGEAATPVRGIIMGIVESSHEVAEPAVKEEPESPFVEPATEPQSSQECTPENGTQPPSPIGTTAQTSASPSNGWSSPVNGWSTPQTSYPIDD